MAYEMATAMATVVTSSLLSHSGQMELEDNESEEVPAASPSSSRVVVRGGADVGGLGGPTEVAPWPLSRESPACCDMDTNIIDELLQAMYAL